MNCYACPGEAYSNSDDDDDDDDDAEDGGNDDEISYDCGDGDDDTDSDDDDTAGECRILTTRFKAEGMSTKT